VASIYFVGTYQPIMCGIGDYTHFVARELNLSRWKVLSFDLDTCGLQMTNGNGVPKGQAWYGIPSPEGFSAQSILAGLRKLGGNSKDAVLWFQHEHGIWRDDERFVRMFSELRLPKIVTFHTLHFQSVETPSGLRGNQYQFLRAVFPHVDAITVFSQGVYQAVTSTFPQYRDKVLLLRHGVHLHPKISGLSRKEAKEKLDDFLLYESDLTETAKKSLHNQHVFLDPEYFIIGQAGFLCPSKQSELLYQVRDALQKIVPRKRILAVRIGTPRDSTQRAYARRLRLKTDNRDKFLLETCLPEDMLRVAQRAFDLNFYWPKECSQSGILAHALGVGAIVAGRQLEGSGEALRMAGAITTKEPQDVISSIKSLVLNPEIGSLMEKKALNYAREFSWRNQAKKHSELARKLIEPAVKPVIHQAFEKASPRTGSEYAGVGAALLSV
jgi:glycosyltransferase involved in cell wall biosynthesis